LRIYLDYAATHPPVKPIIEQSNELYLKHFANSSGLSGESQKVNNLVRSSRSMLADLFSVSEQQLFFYSTASEIHSSLLWLFARKCYSEKKRQIRVACSPFEHPSILETVKKLPNAETYFFDADENGIKDVDLDKIKPDIIICMAANNETGILMPVIQLINWAEKNSTLMLCDCVQLAPKLYHEHIDNRINGKLIPKKKFVYFTLAGHKIGAGFGCALLIAPSLKQNELNSLDEINIFSGGNQESPFRPGSHNLASIKAMELAMERILNDKNRFHDLSQKSQEFEKSMLDAIPGLHLIGKNCERLPGTSLMLIPDISIDFLLMALDQKGITVGTGTSCKSRSREPSGALIAMGYKKEEALQAIRVSFGPEITHELLKKAKTTIVETILSLQNQ
jgi:cysteine desulfurase